MVYYTPVHVERNEIRLACLCALGNEGQEMANKPSWCRVSGTGDYFVHLVMKEKINKLNWCRVSGTGDYFVHLVMKEKTNKLKQCVSGTGDYFLHLVMK